MTFSVHPLHYNSFTVTITNIPHNYTGMLERVSLRRKSYSLWVWWKHCVHIDHWDLLVSLREVKVAGPQRLRSSNCAAPPFSSFETDFSSKDFRFLWTQHFEGESSDVSTPRQPLSASQKFRQFLRDDGEKEYSVAPEERVKDLTCQIG